MITFIIILGWIGVIFLAIQSGPQIIKLLSQDTKVDKEGKKPFYFLVMSSFFGVYYGLLLENKILHIGVANLIGLALSLLTIGLFIYRINKRGLYPFIFLAIFLEIITIVSTIIFYQKNVFFEKWYILEPLIMLTGILNIIAFLPYTIKSLKTKDMSQISVFVLYNGFFLNVSWLLNWTLGKVYGAEGISTAPIYILITVLVFQSFGVIFCAYQLIMWYKYRIKPMKKEEIQKI